MTQHDSDLCDPITPGGATSLTFPGEAVSVHFSSPRDVIFDQTFTSAARSGEIARFHRGRAAGGNASAIRLTGMNSPAAGALRLLRASGLAVVAYALASVAHMVAGGALPTAAWMASIYLLTFCSAVVLTGRRLGRAAIVTGLGVSQLALHEAFRFLSAGGNCAPVSFGHPMHSGHETVMTCADRVVTMPVHHSPGLVMLAAHALAAALVGVVLARGEAAVWFLAGLVWPAMPSRARVFPMESAHPVALHPRPAGRQIVCSGGLGRRGPPAGLPAAAH